MTTVPNKIPAVYNGSPAGGGSSDFGTLKWFGPYTVNYTAIGTGTTNIALILDDAGSNAGILEDIFVQTTARFSEDASFIVVGYSGQFNLNDTESSTIIQSVRDYDLQSNLLPKMPNKAVPSFTFAFNNPGAALTTGQCKIYAKYVIPPFGNISLD